MSLWCTSRTGVVIGTGEDATCKVEACDWLASWSLELKRD